jgi:replicative DNA helicase
VSDYVDEVPPEDPYSETPATPGPDPLVLFEQGVIGGALAHPHIIVKLEREVSAGDFHDMRLGRIFAGLIELHVAGTHIDYLGVWDQLGSWDVRGIELPELGAWAHTPAESAIYYATRVREASVKRLLADVGSRLQEGDTDAGVAMARAAEELRRIRDMSSGGKSVRWLREVLDVPEEDDAYDWVIPGLLERQDRLMLSAGEGVGKSTLLRQIAILGAAGIHPFNQSLIDPLNVLVIDAENSERQWRRAARSLTERSQMIGSRDPRNHLALHCVPVMDITKPNDLGQIHRWIDEAQPDLLLLGPLYRMTSGSLNKEEDAKPVLNALDSIRERGVAMLIEVHAGLERDSAGERGLRPRGSSTLLGWPEFGLGLRRDKKFEGAKPTFSLVRWRGDRDRREWPTRLIHGMQWPWEQSH